tara:strand:+ start:2737 stop:3231 length:495 start_codon:yes stop_codon:yes gene_type:complete
MKKNILLFAILLASCNAPVEEPKGSGYWAGQDGTEKFVNASDELTDIYSQWVQAHNDKDIEKIISFETDSITIELANGNVINGSDQHAEALSNYFESNPNWNLYWALPYEGVSNGEEWIIAGQYVTSTNSDGEETATQIMIDAQFIDGRLNYILAYEKEPPTQN